MIKEKKLIRIIKEAKTVVEQLEALVENEGLTYKQAAEYLHMPVKQIYRAVEHGLIKSDGYHKSRRFKKAELDKYKDKIQKK